MKRGSLLLLGGLGLAAAGLVASQPSVPAFPHEVHERLFPVCEGCHAGVVTGVADELYPEPLDCARCHDGTRVRSVEWERPGPRASNLDFHHPRHRQASAAVGESADCGSCHAAGDPSRMSVAAAPPAACLQCHAHAAETHLAAAADCSRCHLPLAEAAGIPGERVAHFPRPPSHEAADFLSAHAPDSPLRQASCGVCHARESCARCHANADQLAPIRALAHDPRVAALVAGRAAEYPLPASHLQRDWDFTHGPTALAQPTGCANCHTRPSCGGCHIEASGRAGAVVQSLPAPQPDGAAGVSLAAAAAAVHPAGFAARHGSWAGSGNLQCAGCHGERFCSDCHAGSDSRAFHPANFMERHALEVFAGAADCQSCHSTERFCRDCHSAAGLASDGRMNAAFHTGQALWVLSHGQAARRGLDACASCHRQSDCLRCHSAAGGWGVNPHGPGFSASRIGARNRTTCGWCHLTDPQGRE